MGHALVSEHAITIEARVVHCALANEVEGHLARLIALIVNADITITARALWGTTQADRVYNADHC